MIRKLKLKIILTNFIIIFIVIITAFFVLYYNRLYNLEQESIEVMSDIAHSGQSRLDEFFDIHKPENPKYQHLSTYILDVDQRTGVCYIDGFENVDNLTDERVDYINSIINEISKLENNQGTIFDNLRYFRLKTRNGIRIVLLDKEYEILQLNDFIKNYITLAVLIIICQFIISIFLANIFTKPIERSISKQKQFNSDISHELKTPLTVINTNADVIISHDDSTVKDEIKWLTNIKDEVYRMTEMINSMLYLAKNDEQENTFELKPFNLSNAILEATLPLECVCYENKKVFSLNVDDDIHIIGNETSIKQLVIILLDNAIKYSEEHGKINISLSSNNGKVILSVFNSGNPIPKESLQRVFDRFYRIDEARSRESGGNGLGLSIAKMIVEKNDATIDVSSDVSSGTTFTCTFKKTKVKNETKT